MSKSSISVKAWRKRTKERMVKAMGGSCVVCEIRGHPLIYDFHHVNKNNKEQTIGALMSSIKSWSRIVKELRRCVLVCSNCHRLLHYKIISVPSGARGFDESFLKYKRKPNYGICPTCGRKLTKKGKYCSQRCTKIGQRKVKRPNKRRLSKLVRENGFRAVGKMFGVSDNAVRKWM